MARVRLTLLGATLVMLLVFAPAAVRADPTSCQTAIAKQLQRYKKVSLRAYLRCLRLDNLGRIGGPCPDTDASDKVTDIGVKVAAAIADACTMADLSALGFPANCSFEAVATGIEGTCAGLPVTTPEEFAVCLECWKGAELTEFMALLFASHAVEFCGGALDATSSRCSDLDCTAPLPVQHDLGNTGENDCQTGIGKGGFKYLIKREKALENCALAGGTRASCLADLAVQELIMRAEDAKQAIIQRKCGNRVPTANPPFCCRTGVMDNCAVVATREDCVALGGGAFVMENKTCNAGTLKCDALGGPNQPITWWENCPESATCPGTTLASIQDVMNCVDTSADEIVDELLCLQFRGNGGADWPCPTDTD